MRSAIAFFSTRSRTHTRLVRPLRQPRVRRTTRRGATLSARDALQRAGAAPSRRIEPTHAARRIRPEPLMPRGFLPARMH
jgi:hypothetical protein